MTRAEHAELCDMVSRLERIVLALKKVRRCRTHVELVAAKMELARASEPLTPEDGKPC
jgi:hypothetical protein